MIRSGLAVSLLFIVLMLLASLANLPAMLTFPTYAFEDPGANLAVNALLRQGDRPGLDDGYHYGPGALALGQLWFRLLGQTPWALTAAIILGTVIYAWGLARFAHYAEIGPVGILLLAASCLILLPNIAMLVYVVEASFLTHALAEQARGRRARAVTLVTVAATMKASMAVVYGFILVVLLAIETWKKRGTGLRDWVRAFGPAAATGLILLVLLSLLYGPETVQATLVPARAARIYRENHFGFFGERGRFFWHPPGARIGYYLGTPAGIWLVGSLVLFAGAIEGLWYRWRSGPTASPRAANAEVVATCAVLHAAFIGLFFAHTYSWSYYTYILLLGIAAMAVRSRWHTWMVAGMTVLALLGSKVLIEDMVAGWREKVQSPATYGLWSRPDFLTEWKEVRRELGSQKAATLAVSDGLGAWVPQFSPPTLYYVTPGQLVSHEVKRKQDQLASAEWIVEGRYNTSTWISEDWPVFHWALDGTEPVFQGKFLRLYHRVSPVSRPRPDLE